MLAPALALAALAWLTLLILAPLTTPIIVRSVVLNGVASATFGWLFWRRGLEAAMVAHACAHVGLQVLGPIFLRATLG